MASATSGVQSIERAFSVLLAVATEPGGITEVARRVDLPVSTVARLLSTLEQLDAVARDDGVTYRIGPTVTGLAAGTDSTLIGRARPFLTELAQRVGETAGLSVLDGDEIVYLDHVAVDNDVQVRDWTGARLPLHVVSSGLVLLAAQRPAVVNRYAGRQLERLTDKTTTSRAALIRRLAAVREAGFVWTAEEFHLGITSIAAPVTNRDGRVVAAVHCHGPSYRFPARRSPAKIANAVVAAARRLSATNLD